MINLENTTNETFLTNILNIELIKTNLKQNGSSFFHAIHYAYRTFRVLKEKDKLKCIQKIRQEISEKMNLNIWFEMYNGSIAILKIIETIKKIMLNVNEIFNHESFYEKTDNERNIFELLFKLIDQNTIEKQILPLWDIECSKFKMNKITSLKQLKEIWFKIFYNKIQISIDQLENSLDNKIRKMNNEKKHQAITKLALLSNVIFDYITEKAYQEFILDIQNYNKWLPLSILAQIYSFNDIRANILIIDYETKMLYEGMKTIYKKEDFNPNLPFIVLLYLNEYHFESLGKKIVDNDKTIVNRLFTKDDPLIITLLSYFDDNQLSTTALV